MGHMDGPGGKILDELRKDSSTPHDVLKDLNLYLLQALLGKDDFRGSVGRVLVLVLIGLCQRPPPQSLWIIMTIRTSPFSLMPARLRVITVHGPQMESEV